MQFLNVPTWDVMLDPLSDVGWEKWMTERRTLSPKQKIEGIAIVLKRDLSRAHNQSGIRMLPNAYQYVTGALTSFTLFDQQHQQR